MPRVYLLADSILHLDGDWARGDAPHQKVVVDSTDLEGVQLLQMGSFVQANCPGHPKLKLFDRVKSLDGEDVENVQDLKQKLSMLQADGRSCPVELIRQPMGKRNLVATGDRGWVYLERFITMVKGAMVSESDFHRVCFSNSRAVFEEIRDGSVRLRAAAQAGQDELKDELEFFFRQLGSKKFAASSLDKAINGNVVASAHTQQSADQEAPPDDQQVVASIMHDMVKHLSSHWAEQQEKQRHRQLLLAVNRQDAEAVENILSEGVDVNKIGRHGQTVLHRAAMLSSKESGLEVVQTLLKHSADISVQDDRGNLPVHLLVLKRDPTAIKIFDRLAPTPEQLGQLNDAGIKPARRFEAWSNIARRGQPYEPARERVRQLQDKWPEVFRKEKVVRIRRSIHESTSVQRSIVRVCVGGLDLAVDTWTSEVPDQGATLNVVFTPSPAPWRLIEETMDRVARDLCSRQPLNIFMFNEFSLPFDTESEGAAIPWQFLVDIIKVLLPFQKFVFVECFHGFLMPVIWKVEDQLIGVVGIANVASFPSDDMRYSEVSNEFKKFAARQADGLRKREQECLREFHGTMMYGGLAPAHMSRTKGKLEEALPHIHQRSWDMLSALFLGAADEVVQSIISELPPLPDLPGLILLGDNAFIAWEGTEHFVEKRMPSAKTVFIEDSNFFWFLESEDQVGSVCAALHDFFLDSEKEAGCLSI
eukprot:TRINITY_DN80646_c0_g1_i1.p1 TRINITY_DN80646_c0_g1~~TRINITY_DN80646_c0_g1_i1.p1  ORF type:complete len:747 (-),score=156.69 TRINITY_DN80646_c0_g1_i1:150-2261(-)